MVNRFNFRLSRAILYLTILSVCQPALCADDASAATIQGAGDLEKLKVQLAQQQLQLEQLKNAIEAQNKLIEALSKNAASTSAAVPAKPASLGSVASLTPMIPVGPTPDLNTLPAIPASSAAAQGNDLDAPSPLSLKIGNSYITPIGFMDFTSVNRTTVGGNGIGSNFGNIPYNTAATGHLSEFRLSAQNSRIGARFDSLYNGMKVLGYWESDFLGNNNANLAVTNNANTFRLRLYFVDLQKNGWELTAGQTWSLMTPGRTGISPLPGNIFYSQDIDVNYQAGLTWTRQPGFRVAYHAGSAWSFALAAENAEQYVGGAGGAGVVVPPSALTTTVFTEFNNATQTFATPNLTPDFIAKIAYDPNSKVHAEIVGLESNFKSYNQSTNMHYTKEGGGVSANLNFEIAKGLRVLTNNFWSDGGGRYIFGEAPDVVLKGNGDIGVLHAGSTVSGLEYTLRNTLVYSYYGGIYVGRYTVSDPATGKPVGYGYTGSANSQNKAIQEATLGFNQTLWKDAKYGAINFMGQYSYLTRDPWAVATGAPKQTHQNQVYLDLRYTLPGSAPAIK